jgi:hypothetical protein
MNDIEETSGYRALRRIRDILRLEREDSVDDNFITRHNDDSNEADHQDHEILYDRGDNMEDIEVYNDYDDYETAEGGDNYFSTRMEHLDSKVFLRQLQSKLSKEWIEDFDKFKDYLSNPKPSGYRSLHVCLIHRGTGMRMEV